MFIIKGQAFAWITIRFNSEAFLTNVHVVNWQPSFPHISSCFQWLFTMQWCSLFLFLSVLQLRLWHCCWRHWNILLCQCQGLLIQVNLLWVAFDGAQKHIDKILYILSNHIKYWASIFTLLMQGNRDIWVFSWGWPTATSCGGASRCSCLSRFPYC